MSKIGFIARIGVCAAVGILPVVAAMPAQAGVLDCTDAFVETLDPVAYVDHCLLNTGWCVYVYDPLTRGVAPETVTLANCVV